MRDLHVVLPTFAPDYSGVASALYELGGAVVMHDPSGCLGNFVAYDEPRAYDNRSRVYTSALDEVQALLGIDDALIGAACQAHGIAGGRFVAIVGTPNPMILGTDYHAIARIVGERCGVPAFAVDTTGLDTYEAGETAAFLAYAKAVLAPAAEARYGDVRAAREAAGSPRTVNLLGATPLDLQRQENVDVAARMLGDAGWEVASCWSMGPASDPERLVEGTMALCNVVLAQSGLALARWMEGAYGIPWVRGCLSGAKGAGQTLAELEAVYERARRPGAETPATSADLANTPADPAAPATSADGPSALVVADQVLGESMRRALVADLGYGRVDVVSLFAVDRAALGAGDAGRVDEVELARRVRDGGYDLVVGDGLLRGFADAGAKTLFAEVPHAAVSSRISWGKPICPYGAGFLDAVRAAQPAGEGAGASHDPHDVLLDPRLFA